MNHTGRAIASTTVAAAAAFATWAVHDALPMFWMAVGLWFIWREKGLDDR